jgi:hypothetical protein
MRNAKVLTVLLAAGLAFSTPLVAHAKKGHGAGGGGGGGGESMKGGLPGLEDRVEADEALITALQTQITGLVGQNNFAVVDVNGNLVRSGSSAGPVSVAPHTAGTGLYEVDFSKDVSGCAYVATLGDGGTATPPVGFVGVTGATNPDGVTLQTSDSTGTATDEPFHLSVSCP